MIRRHPHVFGENTGMTPEEVEKQWEEIKAEEKSERSSRLDGIPNSLPSLLRAQKLQKKAAKAGFDWPDSEGPADKISEELTELQEALASGDQEKINEEFGDLLFSMVNFARHIKTDAEQALTLANKKFIKRFQEVERICTQKSLNMEEMSLQELDELWDEVKKKS
jgi:MazG family protein